MDMLMYAWTIVNWLIKSTSLLFYDQMFCAMFGIWLLIYRLLVTENARQQKKKGEWRMNMRNRKLTLRFDFSWSFSFQDYILVKYNVHYSKWEKSIFWILARDPISEGKTAETEIFHGCGCCWAGKEEDKDELCGYISLTPTSIHVRLVQIFLDLSSWGRFEQGVERKMWPPPCSQHRQAQPYSAGAEGREGRGGGEAGRSSAKGMYQG